MSDHRDDPDTIGRQGAGPKRELKLKAPIAPGSATEIALNWAGFFVGLLIMTGDYLVAGRTLDQKSWEFIKSPRAMVWIFLVAGQFAFWAVIIEPLWRWRVAASARLRASRDSRDPR